MNDHDSEGFEDYYKNRIINLSSIEDNREEPTEEQDNFNVTKNDIISILDVCG
jgi:hypothetical protein